MADQEYEPDWEVTLRRAGPGSGDGGNTGMYEVICGKCGDNPALDYGRCQRGCAETVSLTTRPGRRQRHAQPALVPPGQRGDEQVNEQ